MRIGEDALLLVGAVETWIEVARDEVDNIGAWRDHANERQFRYRWDDGTVAILWRATTAVTGWLLTKAPAADVGPIQRVLRAVDAWNADRDASRVQSQRELVSDLEVAVSILIGIKTAVTAVPRREESLLSIDDFCAVVGWSKKTFANCKSKVDLPPGMVGDAMHFGGWATWVSNFAKASKRFPATYAECKRRLSS